VALASIASVSAGDAPNPTIKPVTPAAAMGHVQGPGVERKEKRNSHPSRPYSHRFPSLMFFRNIRGISQASSVDPKSSAWARDGFE
jgi:hypothetical protein